MKLILYTSYELDDARNAVTNTGGITRATNAYVIALGD
jgi:hypothetical protein